jgi:hypothetical protein
MKRIIVALLFATVAVAQEKEKPKSATEQMMDFYIESAKPVAEHERLSALTGPWKVTTTLWFDPAGEPQRSAGTATGKMILGGRFLQIDADTKGAFGSESLTIIGFDRRTSEYTLVGFDTLGTYWISAAGKYDQAEKGVVLAGSYAQPPSGQMQAYRFVWTTPHEREHLLTLYFAMGGKDVRVAETRYTRK